MEILPSAHRHEVADEDILHAVANAIRIDTEHEDGLLFIGPNRVGFPLEVLARQTPDGLVVFHAMPLRPSYRKRYLP